MNLNELKKLLGAGPLTKTLGPVLEQEKDIKRIHRAAKTMGYTRSAVNHALRKNGINQGRGSNQRPATTAVRKPSGNPVSIRSYES